MNGHDFTREQNMEARIRLAAARRELADAVNDATTGIGCLTCDDPQTMNHIRACWKRIYDRYLETDSLIADLAACARNITDGGEWKPSELATESKPIDMAEGCACFTAETPDRVLITPSEPTPGENTAKRLANTLNALTGDVLLDATGIRLLGTRFLFAYHGRLDRPVDYGVNLTSMRFPDRLGLLDRAERYPGFLPLRTVRAVRCMDSRVCDCRTDPGRSVVVNRSEVLPSTTEQGIVRAGAGEHEAQFAMIDPVDKKPVTLDVEFAESRPFAFQRVIPVRVDQRIRVFGHQGLYRLTQFGGIVVLPSQTFPVSFEGRRPGYVVKHRGPPSDRPRCRTFCRYRSAPRVSPACFRQL